MSSRRVAKAFQLSAIALCIIFALRGKPPARAQGHGSGLSVEDARQDDAISNLRESTDKSEARMEQRLDMSELELRDLHDDVTGIKNENRVEFGGIALLGGSGMLMGRRRKQQEQ